MEDAGTRRDAAPAAPLGPPPFTVARRRPVWATVYGALGALYALASLVSAPSSFDMGKTRDEGRALIEKMDKEAAQRNARRAARGQAPKPDGLLEKLLRGMVSVPDVLVKSGPWLGITDILLALLSAACAWGLFALKPWAPALTLWTFLGSLAFTVANIALGFLAGGFLASLVVAISAFSLALYGVLFVVFVTRDKSAFRPA